MYIKIRNTCGLGCGGGWLNFLQPRQNKWWWTMNASVLNPTKEIETIVISWMSDPPQCHYLSVFWLAGLDFPGRRFFQFNPFLWLLINLYHFYYVSHWMNTVYRRMWRSVVSRLSLITGPCGAPTARISSTGRRRSSSSF